MSRLDAPHDAAQDAAHDAAHDAAQDNMSRLDPTTRVFKPAACL